MLQEACRLGGARSIAHCFHVLSYKYYCSNKNKGRRSLKVLEDNTNILIGRFVVCCVYFLE